MVDNNEGYEILEEEEQDDSSTSTALNGGSASYLTSSNDGNGNSNDDSSYNIEQLSPSSLVLLRSIIYIRRAKEVSVLQTMSQVYKV